MQTLCNVIYLGHIALVGNKMAEVGLDVQEIFAGRGAPSFLTGFRRLFYLVTPNETTFQTLEEVPPYIQQSTPFFFTMIAIEFLVGCLKKRSPFRLNDSLSSLSSGMILELFKLLTKGIYVMAYVWVYENYRLMDLPWDSPITWWTAFILADFAYYWLHRMSHEMNILWAAHQVHHSSEDYNFTTALRQSFLQDISTFFLFHIPVALLVPPAAFFAHKELNLLFQFWIHTELVTSLGPLEYIINTPSHHRVHHGRNPYCIDKNYAGTLIIFDKMFGTFAKEEEKVVYGLTHPLNSWDPIWTQLCHYVHIWKTFWATPGLSNKLSVLWKGPGWAPGKPRLGCIEDIPKVKFPEPKYDSKASTMWTIYIVIHFALALVLFQEVSAVSEVLTTTALLWRILFSVWTLMSVAAIMDRKHSAPIIDFTRCVTYLLVDMATRMSGSSMAFLPSPIMNAMSALYLLSALIWVINSLAPAFKAETLKAE